MKWPLAVLQGKGVLGLKAVACGLRAASSASASAILYLQGPATFVRPSGIWLGASHLCWLACCWRPGGGAPRGARGPASGWRLAASCQLPPPPHPQDTPIVTPTARRTQTPLFALSAYIWSCSCSSLFF
jgi:hypothetical protein